MSEPYTPEMIRKILRETTDERLQEITFKDFQMLPTRKIVPAVIIRELINNERARRR